MRNSTIRSILHDRFRAVAQSPGVDLATMLKYALMAQRRQRVRDAVLAVLAVVTLLTLSSSLVLLPLFLAWLVVFVELYDAYESVILTKLTRDSFDPADAPLPSSPSMRDHLVDIADRGAGNVTVFADYSPFVGHGSRINNWSFTMNVAKARPGETVVPFAVGELYDRVGAEIGALGLPGLTVENKLFVNGLDLRYETDPELQAAVLPDALLPPVPIVSERFIHELRDNPRTRARPYLTVSVTGWEGEVVISIFLRFVLLAEKGMMFTEAGYSLLPPLREAYREVDRLVNHPPAQRMARLAVAALGRTFGGLLLAVPNTVAAVSEPGRRRRQHRAGIKAIRGHTFNYGAAHNPRERATDNLYHRYFQQLDKEMYVKAAEQRIMDAVADFLEEHNVDVSDLRDRQTTILNNGIFVTGQAQVTTNSMAAGTGAVARAESRIRQGLGQAASAAQRSAG
ncbi:hypothetical protein ACIBIZ_20395 [Nonomuraea spiralis]|uniref:hypothetical protein n=1 Tax=Nonomuraea TaxID=83681 RepID=UPI000F7B9213|nr:hypothetical protein [Nonomuraea sp. WAC 01424]RSM97146.1 hypothetical protein DMB42_47155 [Nonomuraea sp. WAC 01424]